MAASAFSTKITVNRYTTAGLPDGGVFAPPTGKLVITVPGQDFLVPMAIAIAPDNSIVVAGEAASDSTGRASSPTSRPPGRWIRASTAAP